MLHAELYKDRIMAYKNAAKTVIFGVIGLSNGVKFEYSDLEIQEENEIQFLFFQKNKKFSVLFCESIPEFLKWVQVIKPLCVLSDFQEYYTFEKVIGTGTFAKVVLCTRNSDKKEFAVKVFDKTAMKKARDPLLSIRGLQNELNIMHEIEHPNVIKMYEIYEGHKHFYIVLELLTGGELFKKICNCENFSERTVQELMRNLLQALEYLHAKQIMHRDIKPENIILKKKEGKISDITLADFGLSEHVGKKKQLFRRCGTPGYVAPEILADKPYDTQVDVFSAGIIMYMLLVGSSTFYGESYMEILNKNKKCEINFDFKQLNCDISKNAEELMKSMLKKNPKERVTVKEALKHPWFDEKSASQVTQIHHKTMEKLLQQQHQLIKSTKPANITDSQNIITNSPVINGSTNSQKCLSNQNESQQGSPSEIISPIVQTEKKSRFAGMRSNIEKMNDYQQYNVADLKQKIQNPSEKHKSLKQYQAQQKNK